MMQTYYNEVLPKNTPDSDWYVPQGAIPPGFELKEDLADEEILQQPAVDVQPPPWINTEIDNQPIVYDWSDYGKESLKLS